MHDKHDANLKAHGQTSKTHKKPDRDGEDPSLAPINPPPADGKVRGDNDPSAGSVL